MTCSRGLGTESNVTVPSLQHHHLINKKRVAWKEAVAGNGLNKCFGRLEECRIECRLASKQILRNKFNVASAALQAVPGITKAVAEDQAPWSPIRALTLISLALSHFVCFCCHFSVHRR